VYSDIDGPTKRKQADVEVRQVLDKVAAETDTSDLVVATCLLAKGNFWHGRLASAKMLAPEACRQGKRKWSFIRRFPWRTDLP